MPRSAVVILAATLTCLPLTGCFEDVGSDGDSTSNEGSGPETSSGDGDGDSGDGDGDPSSDCSSGFSCAEPIPDGWEGPVARFLGDEGIPDCGGDYPYLEIEGYANLSAADAECSACSCDEPTGVECAGPEIRFYASNQCLGADELNFNLGDHDVCINFGSYGIDTNGMASDPIEPKPGTGSCAPSGGEATLADPSWGTHMRACSGAGEAGSCGDAGSCVPTPGNPFSAGVCIYQVGNASCPPGPYSQRNLYYQSYEDSRGCSDCDCGDASADCKGQIQVHYNDSCSNLRGTLGDPGNECVDIDDGGGYAPRSGKMIVSGIENGSCPASGGVATGTVTTAEPLTFCCTQ